MIKAVKDPLPLDDPSSYAVRAILKRIVDGESEQPPLEVAAFNSAM